MVEYKLQKKKCETCNKEFRPYNSRQKFCNNPCKNKLTPAQKWLNRKGTRAKSTDPTSIGFTYRY